MNKEIRKIRGGVIDCKFPIPNLKIGQRSFPNVVLMVFLLVLAIAFQNCEESSEVCQDIRATNYDVSGRKTCKNCCEFPQLVMEVGFKVGDSLYIPNKTYYTANKDSFKIDSTFVYLSDFQLFAEDGKSYTTLDSLSLFRTNDTLRILNSFAGVSYAPFEYPIGTFPDVGKIYKKIRFKIGLNDTAKTADPIKMIAPHPLSKRVDSLNLTTQKAFIFNRLKIRKGVGFRDSVEIRVLTPAKTIELPMNIKTTEGVNAVIPLRINYLQLFEGVSFSDQTTVFRDKVVSNLEKIFSVK
jgi:hypothetical protein